MQRTDERRTTLIKAIVQGGVLVPRDPLPADWQEGTEVEVEKKAPHGVGATGIHAADAWMDEVERCAAQQDPADDQRLQWAIDEERRLAKESARQGLL
jgi:hypothetical protein